MAEKYPLVLVSGEVQEVAAPDAVQGTGWVWPLLGFQNAAITTTSLTDTLLAGTNFTWDTAFQPVGRSVYVELVGSTSVATIGVVVTVYTLAGVALSPATSLSSTTVTTARSTPITLTHNTTYQLRWKVSASGTGRLHQVRLVIT